MRICSFLPSATEILFVLNLGDSVAGITYECDYPPEARQKPVVVNTRLEPSNDPAEIDRLVGEFMSRGESLYRIETDLLREIRPDLIITQDLCRVCAASPGDLGSALAALARAPEILSLNPHTLDDVWKDILSVGRATGQSSQAAKIVATLRKRVAAVELAVAARESRPRVLCLEWLAPPFVAGHWVPDMVARAGGIDVLGRVGEAGYRADWDRIFAASPEVVVVMPCGYHLEQAVAEFGRLQFPWGWQELPAVRNGRVFAVDASSYFSRPGPRLAEGVEILAHLSHPQLVPLPPAAHAIERLG